MFFGLEYSVESEHKTRYPDGGYPVGFQLEYSGFLEQYSYSYPNTRYFAGIRRMEHRFCLPSSNSRL